MIRIRLSEDFQELSANIKVIGVGGAGGNAINRMSRSEIKNVELIAANTDAQDLRRSLSPLRIQLGAELTGGLGAGGNPTIGRQAAEESREKLKEVLNGADMVFITAGMGGGTGTGAAPVAAEIARSSGALTVAVVTRPFEFEHRMRASQAEMGIKELRTHVDTLLVIPNDRIFAIIDEKTKFEEAFRKADDVLCQAVQSISDVITTPGEINVDFADVKSIMLNSGEALMGIGYGTGPDRVFRAAQVAITSPLLEDVTIDGAKGVLVNITGSKDITLFEIKEGMSLIHRAVSPDANVFYGQVFDDSLGNTVRITVIATGIPKLRPGFASHKMTEKKKILTSIKEDLEKPAYLRRKIKLGQ